jgi:hypothetical protein
VSHWWLASFYFFETVSHYTVKAALELSILLPGITPAIPVLGKLRQEEADSVSKQKQINQVLELTPVIPATWEAEIRRITI